jgi:flavocytochrome c
MSTVIVVGGGLAGLSACHTILERGGNVLLLDKNPFMGGNSTKATSGINGAGTATQHEVGIPDSAKIFFEDTKRSARDLARDHLIKVLTGRSGDAVNWLQDKFSLDLSKVSRLGGHSQPRTHRGGAQFPGMVITYAQLERLEDLAESSPDRVKIILKARVSKLLYESGTVVGVEYQKDGKSHVARGPVILATGGYAADFTENSLLKKHRPEYYGLPTTNGDHCTGDGHKMALAIGASAIDLEKVQVHPTGLVDPKDPEAKVKFLAAEALRGCGGLLLDNQGQRFADELGHRDYVTGRIWENGKYPIRLLLNGQASNEIEWHCKHYVGRGLMKRFENGHELAKEFGLDPSILKRTFDEYNEITQDPKKDPFGKKYFPGGKWSLDGFFHVAVMTPVLHYTMGGLEIDDTSRVVSPEKAPIPGLFACGEVAGGVHGANRLGGSSLLGCVVFGRVAGDNASAYLLQNSKAAGRLSAVAGHLLETKVKVDPSNSKLSLEFSWADDTATTATPSASSSHSSPTSSSAPPSTPPVTEKAAEGEKSEPKTEGKASSGEYTLDDVAKHNTKEDIWVVVNGQVLDVTKFLPDHPGGEKAILLFAGKDASEEFNMLHDPKVISRYAADAVIGKLKA